MIKKRLGQTFFAGLACIPLALPFLAQDSGQPNEEALEKVAPKAYEMHDPQLQYLGVIRDSTLCARTPRFQDLLRRIGLTG